MSKKSVKWITPVALVDRDVQGFYEGQGWGRISPSARARIDQPSGDLVMAAGTTSVPIKGIAFGGNRGVARVDISLGDRQSWQPAMLDSTTSPLARVFWSYAWSAPGPGTYTMSRATDGDGLIQTATVHGTAPAGATGYHRITIQLK